MRLPLRLFSLVMVLSLATAAGAQDVKVIGTYGKWIAQTYKENGQLVCFMSGKPEKTEGNYKARGDVMFMVTHRPGERAFDVVSVAAGYQYLPDSDTVVTSDGKKFNLFTSGERAWALDQR